LFSDNSNLKGIELVTANFDDFGLKPATYTLAISASKNGTYPSFTIAGVTVAAGRTTVASISGSAIQRGIDYLVSKQTAGDGSWNEWGNPEAETAMAVLAMLNAGYPVSAPAVKNGLEYIRSRFALDGHINGPHSGRFTFYTSLSILPFCAAYKISDQSYKDVLRPHIEMMREWLISSQWDENCVYGNVGSDDWYYGGFGYGNSLRPDLSNTQWALMGIHAADDVLGLSASETYAHALVFLGRCQKNDGGSGYTPDYESSVHTMTAASVWSYSLCGLDPSDSRVARGIQWVSDNYSVENNDGWGSSSWYYYKLTFAKAMIMTHRTRLGGHDWFADLSTSLLGEQLASGAWDKGGSLDGGSVISTAWSIMSIQTRELPPGANLSMSIILNSHADVHVYDTLGRHMGIKYGNPPTLEQNIPGATFVYRDSSGNAQPFRASGVIPSDWTQIVTLPLTAAGAYRIELTGTSDGPFDLTILGSQNGIVVSSNRYSGSVTTGQDLATTVTATAMEGALTLLYESLKVLPVMTLSPAEISVNPATGTVQTVSFTIKETGGGETLHSVSIHCTDIVGTQGVIPAGTVTFTTNNFDVPAGGTLTVTASFPIPAGLIGPQVSGSVIVESADGGTKSIQVKLVPPFVDVTALSTVTFPGNSWTLDRASGAVLGTLMLQNNVGTPKVLKDKFWYVVPSGSNIRLAFPDGVDASGNPYVDITAAVTNALSTVGNGDQNLDPGETVMVPGIKFFTRDLSIPSGYVFAVWADPPAGLAAELPRLDISRAASGVIALSWPVTQGQCVVEKADSATSTSWRAIQVSPVVRGQVNTITLPVSAGANFYRLRRN
jgi:hypothetical protein